MISLIRSYKQDTTCNSGPIGITTGSSLASNRSGIGYSFKACQDGFIRRVRLGLFLRDLNDPQSQVYNLVIYQGFPTGAVPIHNQAIVLYKQVGVLLDYWVDELIVSDIPVINENVYSVAIEQVSETNQQIYRVDTNGAPVGNEYLKSGASWFEVPDKSIHMLITIDET